MPTIFSKFQNIKDNSVNENEEELRIDIYSRILKDNPEFINCRNADGETALLSLCKNFPDEYKSIKFLLDKGSSPNIPDKYGDIPYTYLKKFKNKYSNIMDLLLEYGSNKKIEKNYINSSSCIKTSVPKKLNKEEMYLTNLTKLFSNYK